MAENKRLGVYICSGFGIGEAIDCEKLAEDLKKVENVVICKVRKDLCTEAGAEEIKKDIVEHQLEGVVIGASSPRFHTDIFKFDPKIAVDRVNLREQVAWTHNPREEETQRLALDYMMMGIAKLNTFEPPEPMILYINETIMVVGGGVTGMNAALASAKAGYNVILVEKEAELGGFYRKLHRLTPTKEPFNELMLNPCDALIEEVKSNPKIEILTNTRIISTSGQPGMFDVTASSNGEEIKFQVGTIVQATGWIPYDATKLSHLGYGLDNVITNIELEERVKNNTFDASKSIENVVFIQCAGSRDENHLPYCSTVCCMTSLKQALYIRDKYPDAKIYIIYKDIRTPGPYELFYKRVQSEDNIFLTKGEIKSVEKVNGHISITVSNTLLGEEIGIDADLLVLATGMVPTTAIEENGNKPESEEEPKEIPISGNRIIHSNILNLTYRQGPELPLLKYGFPDSHYICFPYETRRTGIYAAGTVRAPMDSISAKSDAYGAALKAIQAIVNIKKGTAVHPRSGDMSFPDFFLQRCTQCKRCTEECPFGTLDEDAKGTPKPNPNRCRRCAICMGACPERIISFKNYSVRMISEMIKSIYIPTEEEDGEATPRILCFMCENDAYPSLDIVAAKKIKYTPYVRIIPLRCLGSTSISWIADSLSQGFDGVILFGCKYGDDYQCHFIRGSEIANTRMENVQEKLKQLVLEPERVELHMLSIDEYDKIPEILNNFAELIEKIGPNPYKEM